MSLFIGRSHSKQNHNRNHRSNISANAKSLLLSFIVQSPWWGVWKSRKPESGIGTGMGTGTGTGTGTVMWRGTDTRKGTSFTLNYFNSNSIYTENKKTRLVSCSPPPNIFILRQREGRKSRKQQLCECIALSVDFFTALCTTTTYMFKS